MSILIHTANSGRQSACSLSPFLKLVNQNAAVISGEKIKPEDLSACRWVGCHYAKGVTSVSLDLTIFSCDVCMPCGLHAQLVAGRPDVDPFPLCYEEVDHIKGFGSFIRWVYFSSQNDDSGIIGVDWSIIARKTAGIATTMASVSRLSKVLLRHGLFPTTELVLLNGRMQEEIVVRELRCSLGLLSVNGWVVNSEKLFGVNGSQCPRCGMSRQSSYKFCSACGCKIEQNL